jgi:hypothetical protein
LIGILTLALFTLAVSAAGAADAERRVPVAVCVSETATLARREAPGRPWQIIKEQEELFSGDQILGGATGAVDALNGAVRLAVVGDVDRRAPLAILETVFVLHEAKDVDLDLTLERGRIRLINLKKEGAARVRLHVRDKAGEITLAEPGTTLSIELYGLWRRGVPFSKEPKPGEEPGLLFTMLAVKGEVDLKGPRHQLKLKAPPGNAVVEGDALEAAEPQLGFLKELPAWAPEHLADMVSTERGKKMLAVMAHWRKLVLEKGLPEATHELLQSDDELERRFAILLLSAMDNLEEIGEVLKTTKHQDVWDAAIVALRHWIGRGPGYDQRLYKGLIERAKYPPREAEGVLQLLHSFGEADLAHPETYQVLINYLGSDRTSLRELAYWHLIRLMPEGRKINYDPLGPKEQRDAAVKEWRKLPIPAKPESDDR